MPEPGEDYNRLLYPGMERKWLMSHAERSALIRVMEIARAPAAIEVGTAYGGSLEAIRRHADLVFSIDIVPEVAATLAPAMPNVEFLTGDSKSMIGVALSRCDQLGRPLGFVLIDGDHHYQAVQNDIHALLVHRPSRPVWVLMHDSSHPECRAGIADARWSDNPHVHAVELDFVTGTLSEDPAFPGMIWGGLALALLLPGERTEPLSIGVSSAKNFKAIYRASVHYPGVTNRVRLWVRTKKNGLDRRLTRFRQRSS